MHWNAGNLAQQIIEVNSSGSGTVRPMLLMPNNTAKTNTAEYHNAACLSIWGSAIADEILFEFLQLRNMYMMPVIEITLPASAR